MIAPQSTRRQPIPQTESSLRSAAYGVPAIEVDGLARRFGSLEAVNGISFTVAEGEIFGFLGPNGAGKTTTINLAALADDVETRHRCAFHAS